MIVLGLGSRRVLGLGSYFRVLGTTFRALGLRSHLWDGLQVLLFEYVVWYLHQIFHSLHMIYIRLRSDLNLEPGRLKIFDYVFLNILLCLDRKESGTREIETFKCAGKKLNLSDLTKSLLPNCYLYPLNKLTCSKLILFYPYYYLSHYFFEQVIAFRRYWISDSRSFFMACTRLCYFCITF